VDPDRILTTNRNAWNHVAPLFYARTALPEYGPLAPTEHELQLLDGLEGVRALELGCGSGHSLRYLADRGASEVWGVDLSPVQLDYARVTLRGVASSVHLIESAMERDSGLPSNHFDLVFSIYGIGWTTDLGGTMTLVAKWLRPGGRFVISGEHPLYSCLGWSGTQYTITGSYFAEGPQEHASWKGKGIPTVIQRRTLTTFVNAIIAAGLRIDALLEPPLNAAAVTDEHLDPARWYSVDRARLVPTTFIIKGTKLSTDAPRL
jgi:SAM-dependent methyltransferase